MTDDGRAAALVHLHRHRRPGLNLDRRGVLAVLQSRKNAAEASAALAALAARGRR